MKYIEEFRHRDLALPAAAVIKKSARKRRNKRCNCSPKRGLLEEARP
ncbi:MAG: hypothetical protein GY862_08940 [Gammaproteobacteria bacterium]|nr:hypothetical protein [Gammaproteobacteria bacterium]